MCSLYSAASLIPFSSFAFNFGRSNFFLSSSAVDQSGSVGSGQPLVNAIRTDSALIGGTKLFYSFTEHLSPCLFFCLFFFGTP